MCGLVGYVPSGKSKINILRFKSLLLYNETRGKLSTGIYNTDGVQKEIINATEFGEKQQWHDLNKNSIFMGHTRQPTLGYPVTLNGAQPMEQDNIVMIHNGSIYNKNELGEQFGVEVDKDDTDSKVLSKILNNKNFEVLNHYRGAAAVIWVYKDDPDFLYYYKGASKRSDYVNFIENERPLFRMNTREGVYFSSLESSLKAIALIPSEVESVEVVADNTVFRININNIKNPETVFEVDRQYSQSNYVKKDKPKHNNYSSKKEEKSAKEDEEANNELFVEDHYALSPTDYWGEDFACSAPANIDKFDDESKTEPHNLQLEVALMGQMKKAVGHSEDFAFNDIREDIEKEEVNTSLIDGNPIYYNKGRYWYCDTPATGSFKCVEDSGKITMHGKECNFVQGILLKDGTDYTEVRNKVLNQQFKYGTVNFAALLALYSDQPVAYYNWLYYGIYFCTEKEEHFTGIYEPKFLNRGDYNFTHGYFTHVLPEIDVQIPEDVSLDIAILDDMQLAEGDIVLTKYNTKIKILKLGNDSLVGEQVGTFVVSEYDYLDITGIEIPAEDVDDHMADEYAVQEIISEALDDLKECLGLLEDYEDVELAVRTRKQINDFVKENFAS